MTHVMLERDADVGVLPASWLSVPQETIDREAAAHFGACDEGDLLPEDLEWRLVIDLPLETVVPLMGTREGWGAWFDAELAMFDEEYPHVAEGYRALMEEPLDTPVVVTVEPGRVQIWDGWHRTATRMIGGAATIPAIVGRLPSGPALVELIRRRESVPAA